MKSMYKPTTTGQMQTGRDKTERDTKQDRQTRQVNGQMRTERVRDRERRTYSRLTHVH